MNRKLRGSVVKAELGDLIEAAGEDRMSGEEFAEHRDGLELTQAQLGKVLGMPQSSIARLESKGITRAARVYRLAFKALARASRITPL